MPALHHFRVLGSVGKKSHLTDSFDLMIHLVRIWIGERTHWRCGRRMGDIGELLPPERGRWARPTQDNRRYPEGMLWIARTGAQWRHLPDEYGKWNSVFSPVPAQGRERHVRRPAGDTRRTGHARPASAYDRRHHRLGTPLRRQHKKGTQSEEALGRSRSGFSTKINARCDGHRGATRYDKTAESFRAFITITSIKLWLPFVQGT